MLRLCEVDGPPAGRCSWLDRPFRAGQRGEAVAGGVVRAADASRMSMGSRYSGVSGGKLAGAFGAEDGLVSLRQLGRKE